MRSALDAAIAGLSDGGGGDPAGPDDLLELLRILYAVGQRDLPLGRLLEGHVDAVQIVGRYGSPGQQRALKDALDAGARLGVWNADLPEDPLRLEDDGLSGGKSFASGAGVLTHAVVTAATREGPQLVLIDLRVLPPNVDADWWRVVGMQRSETHRVRWSRASARLAARIGAPGDYVREPWFSGGALRFTAVQAGGVAGLFDETRDHLVAAGRATDPLQAARLADLYICAERAASAVRRASRATSEATPIEARLAAVAVARVDVLECAECAMLLAQQAVGVQGLFLAHPLSRALTDLAVYLRQPAPDAQRLRAGAAAAQGVLAPGL